MGLALGMAVFFMMWWIVLFMVLPFWVHTPEPEEREDVHFNGAPAKAHILRKMLVNTLVTAILFSMVYAFVEYKPFNFTDIPIGPEFGEKYK